MRHTYSSVPPSPSRPLPWLRCLAIACFLAGAYSGFATSSAQAVQPTKIPADAGVSWLHSTRANAADRAKGWHICEHDCKNQSCDKICHYK